MFESLLFRELNSFSSFVPNVYFSYVCTHMKAILGYNSVTIILFLNLFSIEKELFLGYNRIFPEKMYTKNTKNCTCLPSYKSLCSNDVYFWEIK